MAQPSTVVVVIGTSGTGVSAHPQCKTVIVVVRHVSVLVGQITAWNEQRVVYVVETSVGKRSWLVCKDGFDVGSGVLLESETTQEVVEAVFRIGLSV